MLPSATVTTNSQRRLRNLLAAVFLALAIPTAVIVWQAFGQLKWESFYQYRAQAEALTNRIDRTLMTRMAGAENRSFADFAFVNRGTKTAVLQLSPLAAFPITEDLPGAMGYFQVDSDGVYSTPLIPSDGTSFSDAGMTAAEFAARSVLANQIRQILARNQLLGERVLPGNPLPQPLAGGESAGDGARLAPEAIYADDEDAGKDDQADKEARFAQSRAPAENVPAEGEKNYTQDVFSTLNAPPAAVAAPSDLETGARKQLDDAPQRENYSGRLQDLSLDDGLQKRSVELDSENAESAEQQLRRDVARQRGRRTEPAAVLESATIAKAEEDSAPSTEFDAITTFASDIDPYEFSLLNSGHIVMFRNVWRDGERFVQGMLVDQAQFSENIIANAFKDTTLAGMSDLFVGYQDDIISVIRGTDSRAYSGSEGSLEGTLLFRRALSAPFDRLELVFSIKQLPRGPGAGVLAWSTGVIAAVFLAGFIALYRLGMGQIRLARQQQDFVSAVSHELKTPLTSIRMYGEMLKEGWADEAKQKQYYEYIHDESERLTRLISNVLQLAKITHSDPDIELLPTTVGALMSQVESKISSQVEHAGFALRLARDAESDQAQLHIDSDCFAQVIINLVDNAIKFSRDATDKSIEISARTTKDRQVTFTVRDFGPGIPKDQLRKIFTLFYRTESELTRETVGTGIGLAIVQQLVTAMHGRVEVVNRDPGAQFDVSFPAD